MDVQQKIGKTKFTCDKCTAGFDTWFEFLVHLRDHVGDEVEAEAKKAEAVVSSNESRDL